MNWPDDVLESQGTPSMSESIYLSTFYSNPSSNTKKYYTEDWGKVRKSERDIPVAYEDFSKYMAVSHWRPKN